MEHNSSEVLSKMPTENKVIHLSITTILFFLINNFKIMLKKINDQYKKIYQLQVANKYLKKHKSEEIKILGKKLHLYRKKIKALKFTNELSFNKRTNFLKEKATIDNNKVRFDCLMKIIEKLKIELHTLFRTVQTGKLKSLIKLENY